MGGGPHHDTCRRPASAGARHVRARLSYGLWCGGRALCRHLSGGNQLGKRCEAVRSVQPRKLVAACEIPCAEMLPWMTVRHAYVGIPTCVAVLHTFLT